MSSNLSLQGGPWLDSLRGLFFPPSCLLCNRFMGLSVREQVCGTCRSRLPAATAAPAADESPLDGVFFLYRYRGTVKRLVHRIKMTGDPRCGVWLEAELRRSVFAPAGHVNFDSVVPVPSHRRQSVLAMDPSHSKLWTNALSTHLGVPVRPALLRTITVPKQTSLARDRRLAVSKSSLLVRRALLHGCRSVLLADDVMTTGATARACARALKKSGVERVTLAVIARG